jgi:hypothetical protein
MYFSEIATRAFTIAKTYMTERDRLDLSLSDKQSLRYDIAGKVTELHAARTMIHHTTEEIARGEQARVPVSIDLHRQCCPGDYRSLYLGLWWSACGLQGRPSLPYRRRRPTTSVPSAGQGGCQRADTPTTKPLHVNFYD